MWYYSFPVSSSRAKPSIFNCTAAIGTHAPSLKQHLGASFFAFPSPTVYRSSLHFGRDDVQERQIASHSFSHRCVDLSCAFGAGRLASQEGALMGRLGASLD